MICLNYCGYKTDNHGKMIVWGVAAHRTDDWTDCKYLFWGRPDSLQIKRPKLSSLRPRVKKMRKKGYNFSLGMEESAKRFPEVIKEIEMYLIVRTLKK